jgi:acyl-coenzyme A synthetase/AMP-(fatty) acid ligase/acyl carrier protein
LERIEPTVSIGKPIANVKIFVLDSSGRLCQVGVPGEIYVGGAGLARGYLKQPALTAERFVPTPVRDEYEGILYRTGDRGCWREDGKLEFLGRLDNQVKIRGFRIELDEVELALVAHKRVRSAAVLCKEDSTGARYLAAYVEVNSAISSSELRDYLRDRLPYYMIPDILTVVPKLPLNVNSKVDRATLRAINDFCRAAIATEPTALSALEAILLRLFSDVLRCANLTINDNFFELGGSSLRVMELVSRIRGELGLKLELLDIYAFPTIRELGDRLSQVVKG